MNYEAFWAEKSKPHGHQIGRFFMRFCRFYVVIVLSHWQTDVKISSAVTLSCFFCLHCSTFVLKILAFVFVYADSSNTDTENVSYKLKDWSNERRMSLQSDYKLRSDPTFDAKWSDLDLVRVFNRDELCNLWNELVQTGELVSASGSGKCLKARSTLSFGLLGPLGSWP